MHLFSSILAQLPGLQVSRNWFTVLRNAARVNIHDYILDEAPVGNTVSLTLEVYLYKLICYPRTILYLQRISRVNKHIKLSTCLSPRLSMKTIRTWYHQVALRTNRVQLHILARL